MIIDNTSAGCENLPELPYSGILCRYNEIATKGANRGYFEERLVENLHRQLAGMTGFKAQRERGRILLLPKPGTNPHFTAGDIACLRQNIKRVFGICSSSPVITLGTRLSTIEQAIDKYFPAVYQGIAKNRPEGVIRYAMRARRSNRDYPLNSHQLELYFAEKLLPAYPRLQVDLQNPEILLQLEVRKDQAFLSLLNFPGPGGMPSGTAGRTLTMLSGGIDSPVAAYMMMRRGCSLDFITFHSSPYTPEATLTKVARLTRALNQFQTARQLYCINLLPAQKIIRDYCNPRYRTILYRRLMVRIACRIAAARGIPSLTTGDNLGQVASQTMPNLAVIEQLADRPIFRPLLTHDKNETTAIARQIGTFEISREPVPDSCTVFAPKRPTTMANLEKVVEQEKKLQIEELLEECRQQSAIINPLNEEKQPLPARLFRKHPGGPPPTSRP